MGNWSDYGMCSTTTCGSTGVRYSTRAVATPAANGGQACPAAADNVRSISCSTTACPTGDPKTPEPTTPCTPVNCVMGNWSDYGQCSVTTCGLSGVQQSIRVIASPASCGGQSCPTDTIRTQACNAPACPPTRQPPTLAPTTVPPTTAPLVDCVMHNWTDYGLCSTTTCGSAGVRYSTRSVATPAANGGQACPAAADNVRSISCSTTACPTADPSTPDPTTKPVPVDCMMGNWSDYGQCSVTTCGSTGVQQSTRVVARPAANGGKDCPTDTLRTQACSTTACPPPPTRQPPATATPTPTSTAAPTTAPPVQDCVMGNWSDYGLCSTTTCGSTGVQQATRVVVTPAANGGRVCPAPEENVLSRSCSTAACPPTRQPPTTAPVVQDCVLTNWTDFGLCSTTTCNTVGVQVATRSVMTAAANGGQACPTDLVPPRTTFYFVSPLLSFLFCFSSFINFILFLCETCLVIFV